MQDGPLFVTHHGAGSSGLSFAAFTSELQKILPKAGVLSLDARGHGLTTITSLQTPKPPFDLSLDTLSADLVFILTQTLPLLPLPTLPPILLVGHSLGGAVTTHTAHARLLHPTPLGYTVLDVVEGSAIDALSSMESYLSTRPTSFPSLPSAIEWHIRSRTIRNTRAACVSVPALLKRLEDPESDAYTWLTDLNATKPYWPEWFTGLSAKFLNTPGPAKLLLLAGTDRLDKDLTVSNTLGCSWIHPTYSMLTLSRSARCKGNFRCRSSRMRATSCMKTSLLGRRVCLLIFTREMIGGRWCCRPRLGRGMGWGR